MPLGLERRHNTGQLHFITFSCYHRLPYLEDPASKSTLEQVIEKARQTHNLAIYACVLMPEHVHLTNLPRPTAVNFQARASVPHITIVRATPRVA